MDEKIEDLERVNKVNLMGVIYTLKAGLPGMLARKQGRVLMMASLMAMFGQSLPTPPSPTSHTHFDIAATSWGALQLSLHVQRKTEILP